MERARWAALTAVLLAVTTTAVVVPFLGGCGGGSPTAGATETTPTAGAETTTTAGAATTATPQPTGSASASVTALPTITVTAVGDMLFDSAPKRLIQRSGGKAPFAKVATRLKKADFTVGNLECPVSKRGTPVPNKAFTFRGDPRATQGLVYAGFDAVSLANNHARDYGTTALKDTFSYLKAAGIPWAGAGADSTAAWTPAIVTRRGARIAYLAFSEIVPPYFAATRTSPGTAYTLDDTKVNAAIRAAKAKADYVIVSFHWGIERQYSPTARQVAEGRAAIRAGANLVLSHHPHVVEGVEFYRSGLIAYSLGNFVFSPGTAAGRDTMILHLSLGPSGVTSVTAEPVWINYDGQPAPQVGNTAAKRILGVIASTSRGRGTHVSIVASIARLTP